MSFKKLYTLLLLSVTLVGSAYCMDRDPFSFEGGDDIGQGRIRQNIENASQGDTMYQNSGCGEWDQEPG